VDFRFVNCTPHDVNIVGGETFKRSGIVPRVAEIVDKIGEAGGIPIFYKSFGKTENLPEPESHTLLIVSVMVAQANPDRTDLVVPNVVRNDEGQIIGCNGFFRVGNAYVND